MPARYTAKRPTAPLPRLWALVDRSVTGCWLPRRLPPDTCWRIGLGRREWGTMRAPVLSWLAHFPGPIPEGYCVCHLCDVPACVRPDHLFLGTKQQNTDNMWAKGRARPQGMPRAGARQAALLTRA
jgi:hypothetical protein